MVQSRAVSRPGASATAAELERLVEAVRARLRSRGAREGWRTRRRFGAGVRRRRRAPPPGLVGVRPGRAAQHRAGRAGRGADGGGSAVARHRVAWRPDGGRPRLTRRWSRWRLGRAALRPFGRPHRRHCCRPRSWLHCWQLCDAPAERLATTERPLHTARAERLFPGDGGIDLPPLARAMPLDLTASSEIPTLNSVEAVERRNASAQHRLRGSASIRLYAQAADEVAPLRRLVGDQALQ